MSKTLLLAAALLAGAMGCSKAPTEQRAEASLPELNRALQMWRMTHGTYPGDLNQLTNFPALKGKRLPAAPPGQKLALDPATHQITFLAQ